MYDLWKRLNVITACRIFTNVKYRIRLITNWIECIAVFTIKYRNISQPPCLYIINLRKFTSSSFKNVYVTSYCVLTLWVKLTSTFLFVIFFRFICMFVWIFQSFILYNCDAWKYLYFCLLLDPNQTYIKTVIRKLKRGLKI